MTGVLMTINEITYAPYRISRNGIFVVSDWEILNVYRESPPFLTFTKTNPVKQTLPKMGLSVQNSFLPLNIK